MKKISLTAILLLGAIRGYGQTIITGEVFDKINIASNAKIILRQDSVCSVRYSGGDRPSDAISISDGTLRVHGLPKSEIDVSLPVLKEIRIEGFGSITGVSTFNTGDLYLKINGDGKIILDVAAKKVDAHIPGLGKIVLSGTTQDADLTISGSGKIDATGLKTIRSNANISGLGKISIDAIDELNSSISGSGTVSYKSLPKKLNENISGLGRVKKMSDEGDSESNNSEPDTTRLNFGKNQVWFIGKKDSTREKNERVKPIWAGLEMGINSYMDNDGSFTLSPGKENFDLKTEKSISVGLNIIQHEVEIGRSNIWLFTGLGLTWNNYRFQNNVVLVNGSYTTARIDSAPGVTYKKSKLVATYLTAPVMLEVFTSRNMKKAFHLGAGAMLGLRLGSHTKQKIEIDGHDSKIKDYDDFNLSPFRYGFRVAAGYGKFNIYADYYASTLFRDNKGPTLYPINVGVTFVGF